MSDRAVGLPASSAPLSANDLKGQLDKLSNSTSLNDEDKVMQRRLRLTAALSKMLGCIRLKVKDAVDVFHDKCRAEFDTWVASNPSATRMARTERAREIWKGNITDGKGKKEKKQKKLFNFEENFDTLSDVTAYKSKMERFDKDHPDPKTDLSKLQADLANETNNTEKKKTNKKIQKLQDNIVLKNDGVDWAPSTPRETWLLFQTGGFKDFVSDHTKHIEDSRDEHMFFNTMAAIYPTSHAAYNFIRHGEGGGKVRNGRNTLAHGEDTSKGGSDDQEATVQENIQSVMDFLTAMDVDESEWKKELQKRKDGSLKEVEDDVLQQMVDLIERTQLEMAELEEELNRQKQMTATAKRQRNNIGAALLSGEGSGLSLSNINSQDAKEWAKAKVVKLKQNAAEKAKNEQLEKRAAKYEKDAAKVQKKRDQGKSMTSVSAPSTDLAEFMAGKGKQDQQGKSNDADSFVLFDEDDLGDEDDAADEKPAFELKARDFVNGFVTYVICADKEDKVQPEGLKGGQGIVKKAYTESENGLGIKKCFAIKAAINPSRHRQKDEAAIYFKLDPTNEPHLAFLSDVVMRQGQPLLVLEWANKGSLGDWLKFKREYKLPMTSTLPKDLEYAIQIVRGLRTLHSESDKTSAIVHQDLKPGNVLNYNGVLKIADFGLSFAEDDEDDNSGGSGTRGYMAPEQMLARLKKRAEREGIAEVALADLKIIDGESSEVTTACDIWAFGLIVAQMIGEGADTAVLEYIQVSRRDDLQEAAKESDSAVARLLALMADEVEKMDDSKEKNALLGVVEMLNGCLAVNASKRPSAKECEKMLQLAYKELKGERSKRIPASSKRVDDRDIFSVFPQPRVRAAWFHRQVTGDMGTAVELLREQLKEEIKGLLKTTGNAKSSGKKKKKGGAGGSGEENKELRKKVREALNNGGAMVDAVLAECSGWLPSVMGCWKAKNFKKSFVLAVLMHLVQATCLAHDGSEGLEAVERAAALAEQAQRIWEISKGAEESCNFKTGSAVVDYSPMMMICALEDARGGRDAVGTEKALERVVEVMLETVKDVNHKSTMTEWTLGGG
ncbi:hypothetical protein TrVE_jg12546 [Triparma verrucosa]|uniref:Protein kinase domain-containing protein n=1 Tax=Triparma verrucosa TaxID=1606542 RepID=A0A9W7B4Y2_9STRA|nr:hypothetical protein TrVE_jg12546 [Triparma verrucosa]